jgi:hypothetical protein
MDICTIHCHSLIPRDSNLFQPVCPDTVIVDLKNKIETSRYAKMILGENFKLLLSGYQVVALMKTILYIFLFLTISAVRLSAQDTARVIDRVFTADHKIYLGQITDDRKGDSLVIQVYGSGAYTIDYQMITKIQYRVDNPSYVEQEKPTETQTVMKRIRADTTTADLVAFNGYRATPRVTDKLVRKRNIGIGLTIAGATMIGIGAAIYAVTPKSSANGSGGVLFATPSPGSVAGILMIVLGGGITIPGVAIWGSYAHRLRKAEQGE